MRELNVGDQRNLARLLRSEADFVWSDNIAPLDVNILPMGMVVDTGVVDRCIGEVQRLHNFGPILTHAIVISVLQAAAMDIGRGSAEQSEPQISGPTPGAPSGPDND